MNSTNSWATPIDKLMLWRGSWTKFDSKVSNPYLRVWYDQLLITAETKILETINMHQKMKGIYKDDILILIIYKACQEIRKIKFQIQSNAAQCLQFLGQHFPVVNHNTIQANRIVNAKYRNVDDVLKHALENNDVTNACKMTTDFNNFMKLCLLDPTFPTLIFEVEKILYNEITKKS